MMAYCWASGLIEFGQRTPKGAILIAHGKAGALREYIDGVARHGYQTRIHKGRRIKIEGSDHLLVPGVAEAGTAISKHASGELALAEWLDWISKRPPAGVSISPPARSLPPEGIAA
ncbi:hypothetical protein [Rhodopseudomonas sp. BR0G17]|uniref:hypothetical protein n=1 Tax=Rhodopseudomonas sp. BR0G17 TaxID=2269368 RepID=UPI0013E0B8B1|nr:hypothetical protein [Rhodopseudomonas sp. BR0G17]